MPEGSLKLQAWMSDTRNVPQLSPFRLCSNSNQADLIHECCDGAEYRRWHPTDEEQASSSGEVGEIAMPRR